MHPPPADRGRTSALVWVIVVLALVARVCAALSKGLVLDEFHSYYHATRPTFAALLETLRRDNHPPASFLAIHWARALLGESELALRGPALLYGVVDLLVVARLARRCGGTPWLAVALLAASTMHVDCSSEVRMYSLLSLSVTGLLEALSAVLDQPAERRARGAQARVVLWIAVGLHTHYFFVQYLFWIACAVLVAVRGADVRRRARRLLLPALAGGLLALPWYLTGFQAQLGSGLPPGGDDNTLAGLAEAFVHLFFLNVRLGGPVLRVVFIACGVLATVLGVASTVALLRRGTSRTRSIALVLGTAAFGVPLMSNLAAELYPRAGFTWHYVLPSAAPLAVLLACSPRQARVRRGGVGVVLVAASVLTCMAVTATEIQRYSEAVGVILDKVHSGDAVISIEWQPEVFPQGQPWDYYAPRLASGTPPERLAMSGLFPADPHRLLDARRVWLMRTSLSPQQPLMQLLAERYREAWTRNFGYGVDVHLYIRAPPQSRSQTSR